MLAHFILAALAQTGTFLPLEGPEIDDRATAIALDAAGDTLLIAHQGSRSVTRYDVQGQAVNGRVRLGPDTAELFDKWDIKWIPGSRDAVVLDLAQSTLFKIDTQVMSVLGEVSLSALPLFDAQLAITENGATCALLLTQPGTRRLVSIDLGTMTATGSVDVGLTFGSDPDLPTSIWLTSDDQRAVIIGADPADPSRTTLLAYSLAGLALAADATPSVSAALVHEVQQSSDRTTWLVSMDSGQTSERSFVRVRGADLAISNSVSFSGFGAALRDFQVDPTGARGWGIASGSLFGFPIDQPLVTPSSSGVQRFPLTDVGAFAVCGDGSRVITRDGRSQISLFDGTGTLIADAGSSLHWQSSVRAYTPAVAVAPVFAFVRDQVYDQMMVLDGRVPAPAVAERAFNSSALDSFDGPYGLQQIGDSTEVAVVAIASSKLRIIDVETGATTAVADLLPYATDIDVRQDGHVLVGHRDGTLLVIDPDGATPVGRIALGGIVEQVRAEPSGTRAWIRVGGSPGVPADASLVLVETQGSQAGVLGSVPLSGSVIAPVAYWSPWGGLYTGPGDPPLQPYLGFQYEHDSESVAFDFARGQAYALSPFQGVIETIDLANLSRVAVTASSASIFDAYFYPQLTLAPGGAHLIESTRREIKIYRTAGPGLTVAADLSCPGQASLLPASHGFSSDGSVAYLANAACGLVQAVDIATGQVLDEISTIRVGGLIARDDDVALLGPFGIALVRFNGTRFSVPERVLDTPLRAPALFHASAGLLVSAGAGYGFEKGLRVADLFEGRQQIACDGNPPNATGAKAELSASGSVFAGETLALTASGLAPFSMLGVLGISDALSAPAPAASGLGSFCLGGSARRALVPIRAADASGQRDYSLTTGSLGTSTGSVTIRPGETWVFQEWHRDTTAAGLPTSNVGTALAITFR